MNEATIDFPLRAFRRGIKAISLVEARSGTALSGAKLPMGVTRHTISGMALGLNVDLVMLDSDIPLEQKNLWLDNLIKTRIKNKRVRFYPEPVFRFDE